MKLSSSSFQADLLCACSLPYGSHHRQVSQIKKCPSASRRRNGEVSRAMRNRGIELFMLPDPYQLTPSPQSNPPQAFLQPPAAFVGTDSAAVADAHSLLAFELESVMSADGVPGCQPAACLAAAHLQLVQQAANLHRYGSVKTLL